MIWLSLLGTAFGASVVINEAMVNPYGSDAGREWVELYNASDAPVSLTGWDLRWALSSSTTGEHELASVVLEPGEFYVISGELVGGGDELAELSFGNASSNADIIQLVMGGGAIVDSLIYGTSNADGWLDDSGVEATSLAPKPSEGQSIARAADGVDSDACGEDFLRFDDPTIGSTNADGIVDTAEPDDEPVEGFEPSTCPGADAIKLNEVMVNPSGADTDAEWVELYNAGSSTVSLDGWAIVGGTSSFSAQHTFSGGVSMAPGEYLLVGGALVPTTDVLADLNLGNAGSNGDAVRLLGCDDRPADTLIYGGSNDDEWVDDEGFVTSSLAPKPGEGSSLARISDGYDTDDSRDDWVASAEPTPGYANPYTEPIECQPGWKQVKINEFMANPAGSDGGAEWVELYNPHDETVTLMAGRSTGVRMAPSAVPSSFRRAQTSRPGTTCSSAVSSSTAPTSSLTSISATQAPTPMPYSSSTVTTTCRTRWSTAALTTTCGSTIAVTRRPLSRPPRETVRHSRAPTMGKTRIGPVMTLSSRMSRPPVPPTPRQSPWSVCRGS